jgi:hypothetical protein
MRLMKGKNGVFCSVKAASKYSIIIGYNPCRIKTTLTLGKHYFGPAQEYPPHRQLGHPITATVAD